MKDKHINTIRKQFGVTLDAVYSYNRDHRNDIEHIKDIFTLKGDYKEKYLALLYMFCSDTEDFVRRYREQQGLNKAEYEPSVLLEQYKVLLITALVYNDDFYAMVINDIGFASVGIDIGNVEEKSNVIEIVKNDEYEVMPVSNYFVFTFFLPIHRQAAAGEGNFVEFYKRSFSHKGIGGTLHFFGNDQQEIYIEFVFDEFMSIIPFNLELCFTTTHDHKNHTSIAIPADENRIIKDREKGITILKSDIISGVDYSEGIESNYTVKLKEVI